MKQQNTQAVTTRILSLKGWAWLMGLFVVAAIVVPMLNLFLPPDSPYYVSNLVMETMGRYMCYAIMALAIDLIWGYTGILSLGHAFFFSLGAYIMGMHLAKYMNDVLNTTPDFMAYMPWKEFPWFWGGFEHFSYGLLMAMLIPGIVAFLFGYFAFRSRVKGVYFAIITQALTFAMWRLFLVNETGFGGNNGFTNFKGILGFTLTNAEETKKLGLMGTVESTKMGLYIITVAVLCLSFILCRYIVQSKFGRVLRAVRDAESRVAFSGYDTNRYKLFVWTVSAVLCAIGGILFIPQVGIINPSEMAPINSIEAVVWVAVGGRGTLVGALLGSGVVNGTKSILTTGGLAEYWLFILGGLAVIVTLYFPGGLVDRKSHIKVAQSVGRLLGAKTTQYAFSNLIPVLVLAFYFGFIALVVDYMTGNFAWSGFKLNCLYAIAALPVYLILNGLFQSLGQGKQTGQTSKQPLKDELITVFFGRQMMTTFALGVLLMLTLFIALDSGKFAGILVLFGLFLSPLVLLFYRHDKLLSTGQGQTLLMGLFFLAAVLFSVKPIWLLHSANYLGIAMLFVVAWAPFKHLLLKLKTQVSASTLAPVAFVLVVYIFLFFLPNSFFWQIVKTLFSFPETTFAETGYKANLFFGLCAAYIAYFFWHTKRPVAQGESS